MSNSTLLQDLRYGFRALRRAPTVTLTALVALALGIGGTSAIFSVVNAVLLAPLPLGNPDRLVAILHHRDHPVAPANFLDWKRLAPSFPQMGAPGNWTPTVTGGGVPGKAPGARLTT